MKEAKHFYAAMYLRLSREDSDGEAVPASGDEHGLSKAESNSIGTQRELIRSFIKEQEDIELFDCYVDDNYSGSNFNRPEFKRMMQDIEAGRVNCAIVKDLSRFGRDYIETGRYLDRVFQALGVRFSALTDRYDSFSADAGQLAFFKNSLELKEIDRHTLASLVKRIWVYEGKQVEIEFYFTDQYRAMEDCNGILAMDEGFRQEAPQNAGETALPEIGRMA
ncbi:MAG: recombinase family protein [Lachnospiraceae bacterium]|nr:recombinase family protein [Lachnospiraceae bacterium]